MRKIRYSTILKIGLVALACLVIVVASSFVWLYLSGRTYVRMSDLITAISTFAIALLTLAYVLTTSRQLSTMQQQLREMKRSRELMSQPLPIVTTSRFILEKPRAFYSPPEESYQGQSRYHVECKVQNHGSSPGVSIHVCACLVIAENDKQKVFHSSAEYVEVIAEKTQLKDSDTFAISFMFVEDDSALVIDAIRSQHPKDVPVLKICTVYKNVLGGAFGCRQTFEIFPKSREQDEIMKNWHSEICNFRIKFKHEIGQLKRIAGKNETEWEKLFEQIKAEYSSKIKGGDQDVVYWQVPGKLWIGAISEKQYQRIVSGRHYAQFMPEPDHCLIEEQK